MHSHDIVVSYRYISHDTVHVLHGMTHDCTARRKGRANGKGMALQSTLKQGCTEYGYNSIAKRAKDGTVRVRHGS